MKLFNQKKSRALVVSTGWVGDTIACSAAAVSLSEKDYKVTFLMRWPQLYDLFKNDRRYKTVTFLYTKYLRYIKKILYLRYDLVILEPESWSYNEPFTCEIRRIANCEIKPEYNILIKTHRNNNLVKTKPIFTIGRDIYKRSYGRDVEKFIKYLGNIGELIWVGLDNNKNSKDGRNVSLIVDAKKIAESDYYIGVEGGLLWIAGGVGIKTIYFTEHILQIEKNTKKELKNILGTKNYFPDEIDKHLALPANIENSEAIKLITNFINRT